MVAQHSSSVIGEWEIHHSSASDIPSGDWRLLEDDESLPIKDTFWIRTIIHKSSATQQTEILYLHGLQDVQVYQQDSTGIVQPPLRAGTIVRHSQLILPDGDILFGRGNTAQVPLQLHQGDNIVHIKVIQTFFENIELKPRLYDLNSWYSFTTSSRSRTYLIQGFIGGALLILSLYHLLIFLIRRDEPFLWYALYTSSLCVGMLLESGILQSSIFVERQWGMIYIPFSIFLDLHYIKTMQVTWLTYVAPISVLMLGLFCVIVIFRKGDKLALYFSIGSLILYLSVFSNTLLSAFTAYGWISEVNFPRVWLTEGGVILEILVFSLGLGYRLRLQDNEKRLAVERLRTNISSDLHDDVGSMLSGLSMQAQVLAYNAPEEEKQALYEISEISTEAMDAMRDTVWAIDARQDRFNSLLDRMRDFAENTLFKSEINYEFKTEGLDQNEKILPNVRQQLYLIYKEAISNILKHSKATFVKVSLVKSNDNIELTIKDNGIGRSEDQHSGLGISNMKMRTERLSGSLILENDNG